LADRAPDAGLQDHSRLPQGQRRGLLCRRLELFSEASVAIDGSKFKAVNTRDRNFTQAKMQRRLAQIDESIARYLSQLDSADRQGEAVPEAKITRLNEKIATLRQEIQRLNALNSEMMQTEDKRISLTDPDARSMATSGRGSGMVGYNTKCRRHQASSHCYP
jgi:TolA-binding protein